MDGGNYAENDGACSSTRTLVTERGRGSAVNVNAGPLTVGANLSYVANTTSVPDEGVQGGAMYALYAMSPALVSTFRQGWIYGSPNQWQTAYLYSDAVSNFVGSGTITAHGGGWFSTHLNLGTNQIHDDGNQTVPVMSALLGQVFGANQAAGRRKDALLDETTTTLDWGANATLRVVPALVSTTSVGVQYYHNEMTGTNVKGQGFSAPGVTEIGGAAVTTITTSDVTNNEVGTYAQEQVALNDRLFLTGALRADDNSAFGNNFTYVLYPKASLSWVASEEPFWHVKPISTFRLRGAFGGIGVNNRKPFMHCRRFNRCRSGRPPGRSPAPRHSRSAIRT